MANQNRRKTDFVTDEQHRLLEIEEARLAVKFGNKKRYSVREYEAIYQELAAAGLHIDEMRDPDAIEAAFLKLNAIDRPKRQGGLSSG